MSSAARVCGKRQAKLIVIAVILHTREAIEQLINQLLFEVNSNVLAKRGLALSAAPFF
jgi:hypothetical protein